MKTFNISSIICSLLLAISIIISSVLIQDGLKGNDMGGLKANAINHTTSQEIRPLLNIKEASDYLNLTENQIRFIITSEENTLKTMGSYSGKMFPYIKVNNEIFISKADLSEWIKEAASQRKEY